MHSFNHSEAAFEECQGLGDGVAGTVSAHIYAPVFVWCKPGTSIHSMAAWPSVCCCRSGLWMFVANSEP